MIDIQKYDLYQVEGKIMKRILIFDLAQECNRVCKRGYGSVQEGERNEKQRKDHKLRR